MTIVGNSGKVLLLRGNKREATKMKAIRTESEVKAIRNLQIARLVIANTPMVTGYNGFSKLFDDLEELLSQVGATVSDISEVNNSEIAQSIRKLIV